MFTFWVVRPHQYERDFTQKKQDEKEKIFIDLTIRLKLGILNCLAKLQLLQPLKWKWIILSITKPFTLII